MSTLVDFFENNEDWLVEEVKLLYWFFEKPDTKICVIDGMCRTDCSMVEGGDKTCKHGHKYGITDPEKGKCRYWIPIKDIEEDSRKEFMDFSLIKPRQRTLSDQHIRRFAHAIKNKNCKRNSKNIKN